MKINLVMIVKDEERSLERCLKQAADLVDEIVIADTGSHDRTREIAESMGAKVWEFPWINDFSAARNFALDKSDGDWNLVLDADEYLHPCSRGTLEGALAAREGEGWIGSLLRYDSYRDGGGISIGVSLIPRLLPKGVRYSGTIHEQPDSGFSCFRIPLEADHDGYLHSDKGERNLPYLEAAAAQFPEDPYYQFQLASTLRNLKRLPESLPWFRRFYQAAPKSGGYRPQGVVLYLYTLLDIGGGDSLEEAREVVVREEEALGDRADFCFVCGLFYMKLVLSDVGRYFCLLPRVESSYRKCLAIGERLDHGGVMGTGSFLAEYNLGTWYEVSGQTEKARMFYKASAESGYGPAAMRLRAIEIQQKNANEGSVEVADK